MSEPTCTDEDGCCPECKGSGRTRDGGCWDCRGTGHPHPPHTAGPLWRDRHGDVWRVRDDGLLETPETRPFPRSWVEKKWGPLVEVLP